MPGCLKAPLVLLVGSAAQILKDTLLAFRKKGMLVRTVTGPLEAMTLLLSQKTSMVVSGCTLPHVNGSEFLLLVRLLRPRTVCVLTTLDQNDCQSSSISDAGFIDHVFRRHMNVQKLQELLEERARPRPGLLELVNGDVAMRFQIRRQASKAALTLAQATDHRDRHTWYHSERVSVIAHHLGRNMNLGVDQLANMCVGALLHDLGKLGISEKLFSNPGRMTTREKLEIRRHPGLGAWLAKALGFSRVITDIIAQHHENHDGTGYPAGRQGDQIVLPARIIRVADAYEAMCANRSFRSAREQSWIREEFKRCRGHDFDPQVTDVLLGELLSGKLDAFR